MNTKMIWCNAIAAEKRIAAICIQSLVPATNIPNDNPQRKEQTTCCASRVMGQEAETREIHPPIR
jgi:hypothetical protein